MARPRTLGTREPGNPARVALRMRLPPPPIRRALLVALATALAGCREVAAPAAGTTSVLAEADIVAVDSLTAAMTASMSAPAVVSLLGVTVPFGERVARPWPGPARALVLPAAGGLAYLGDVPIDPAFAGQTFVRAGTVFRRDTTRRDAPTGLVRVLLYERLNGAATGTVVGWLDVADSLRGSTLRVTRATVGTAGLAGIATVRGSLARRTDATVGTAVFDVLEATVGTGAAQVRLYDSLVVDSLSGSGGRNAVLASMPARNASILSTNPAVPGGSVFTTRVVIQVAGRTVRLDAQGSTGGTSVGAFVDGTLVGTSTTNALPNLGDAAVDVRGKPVPDLNRRWLNAIGRLLVAVPAAADFAQAAGDYVTLLDPLVLP